MFYDLLRTAKQITGEKKTTFHVNPAEYLAITKIYCLEGEEECLIGWRKISLLEDVYNSNRPSNPKPKKGRGRGRRR